MTKCIEHVHLLPQTTQGQPAGEVYSLCQVPKRNHSVIPLMSDYIGSETSAKVIKSHITHKNPFQKKPAGVESLCNKKVVTKLTQVRSLIPERP